MKIGIDAGGSLVKVVALEQGVPTFSSFSSSELPLLHQHLDLAQPEAIYATGCGAKLVSKILDEHFISKMIITPEMTSFCAGARYFVKEDQRFDQSFVLVSLGTGTSIFYVTPDQSQRVTGTAVGGGTLLGLGELMLGVKEFDILAKMARAGNRSHLDLMVGDLYPDVDSPLRREMTAANFGKLGEHAPEDIASAIFQLVLETNALLAIQAAKTYHVKQIIMAGSPISEPLVQERLRIIGTLLQFPISFLPHAPYSGAMGSIIIGENALHCE